MAMALLLIAAGILIAAMSYKWGTFDGYDRACEDFIEELTLCEEALHTELKNERLAQIRVEGK